MKYRILVSLILVTVVFSCKKDDDGIVEVPPSLLSDVAPEDDATIKEFLNTHFYNYEDFDELTMPEGFDYKIVIDTLAGDNAGKRSLMEDAQSVKIKVNSDYLGLSAGEEDIEHTLYYIVVRPGGGGSPTYADSTLVRYQGSLLNGKLFDESQDFTWQELPVTVRGYGNGVAMLNAGTEDQIVENGDGTYDILNSGLGIIVMPSGLAYFNSSNSSLIPSYSPILFKVELGLYVEDTDRDNDGIPSIEEDLNGNGYLYDDNTDAKDESRFAIPAPNFNDADDDGDGVSTRSEITDDNGNIIKPYPDKDGDGIPDYLDPDTN